MEHCMGKPQPAFVPRGQKQPVQNVPRKGVKEIWRLKQQDLRAGCLPATYVHYIES